jgi:hypothetical protein
MRQQILDLLGHLGSLQRSRMDITSKYFVWVFAAGFGA